MNPSRINNWPSALALFIAEKKTQPFDWKTNNCGFFACDWLAIVVRVDPAAEYRDGIDGALSAARVIDEAGGIESIAIAAALRWGWPPVSPALARRGDIISFLEEEQPAPILGVCLGELSVFAHAEGLAFRPTLKARKAWRIG